MMADRHVVALDCLMDVDDAMRSIASMQQYADAEKLVIDFSGLRYVKTISAALFARELRLLVKSRTKRGLKTFYTGHDDDKSQALAYLAFVGFFDFIGEKGYGSNVRSVAEVEGVNPHLAITKYSYQRFKVAAEYDPFRSEYDYIAAESQKIARLLISRDAQLSTISYAIREILRNAYEHSASADFFAMGQADADGSVELVIMDDGCGLLSTLKRKYPRLTSEYEAILEAMKPGVSGSDFEHNRYNNSGFGLYVLSEFAKRHGSICIVSGNTLVKAEGDNIRRETVAQDGTFVGLRLAPVSKNAHTEMEQIVAAGEKISAVSEYPVRPSKETLNF